MKNLPNILKEAKATRERLDYKARLIDRYAQDMTDPKNWREGDVVEWAGPNQDGLTFGSHYTLYQVDRNDVYLRDDDGCRRLRSPCEFRWISR